MGAEDRDRRVGRDLLIAGALYLLALAVVLFEIGSHPPFAYNWENYTLWRGFPWWAAPDLNALDLTDGLMTDSGRSWFVLAPSWVAFKLAGAGLTPLRVSTGVIATLSVPLTWLLARRLTPGLFHVPGWSPTEQATLQRAGRWAALTAALLLAVLPAWLLYARTATLVGLSLAPALITILLIDQVRRVTRFWWLWLPALQAALLIDAWAYAPIRFLYPLAIVVFAVEMLFERSRWLIRVATIVVTVVSLPALLALIDQEPGWQPIDAISHYYNARGEQIFNLRDSPEDFVYYLREADLENSTPAELERQLIEQNARDLLNLFLDRETRSALTDFWNQTGRLIPWFVTPLLALGLLATALRLWASPEARLLHVLFWGFTLPMIATSKVHIGRLIFAMPFLCIFVGVAIAGIAWGLTYHLDVRRARRPLLNFAAPLFAVVLLAPAAGSAWNDYHVAVPVTREARLAIVLTEERPRFGGGVVWIGGGHNQAQIEAISFAAVRIHLDDRYQFVNLAAGEAADLSDPRPPVYFGAIVDFLQDEATAAALCALPWLVPADSDPLAGVETVCMSPDVTRVG